MIQLSDFRTIDYIKIIIYYIFSNEKNNSRSSSGELEYQGTLPIIEQ